MAPGRRDMPGDSGHMPGAQGSAAPGPARAARLAIPHALPVPVAGRRRVDFGGPGIWLLLARFERISPSWCRGLRPVTTGPGRRLPFKKAEDVPPTHSKKSLQPSLAFKLMLPAARDSSTRTVTPHMPTGRS